MESILIGNKSLATNFFESLNNRTLSELKVLWAENHRLNYFGYKLPLNNDEHLSLIKEFINAFPDFKFIILDEINEGDRVVVRGVFQGTHEGEYQGNKATGKKVEINFIDIFEILGGKIVNEWMLMDSLELLHQIGVIPYYLKS